MKLFIIFLINLFLLSGCQSKEIDIISTDDIEVLTKEIIVFDDIKLFDTIKVINSDIEVISDNNVLDTSRVGANTYEIKYKKDNKIYSYKFQVNIIDNIPPKVFSGTNKTVVKGYEGDLCNIITYGDNYDGIVNCSIEGDYDLSIEGTYKLLYKLTDSSNNIKEVNVILNVVNKLNNNKTTNSKKHLFSDIYNKYKNDANEIGIDVSKWQGDIDFQKVKDAGATFVMMRIGVQTSLEGELSLDRYFENNFKNAKEAGLKVGVYLYSIATSKEEAINHAKWVIDKLNGETLELPIVFDWENWSKWNSYKISFHDINSIADSYIDTVNQNGYTGMLYSSKFYLENIWENKHNHPVWLAHYTDETSYKGDYIMWQLCNTGRINGINGDVDIDILKK